MTEYTESEERTYEQMLEIAKAISPDARVRSINYGAMQWEIYISSPYAPNYDLSESYKGTPAWDLSLQDDGSYGDELSRWGYKNGHGSIPIDGVADYYNLMVEFAERKGSIATELHKKAGLVPMSEITDWKSITRETAAQYMENQKIAEKEIADDYREAKVKFQQKWAR